MEGCESKDSKRMLNGKSRKVKQLMTSLTCRNDCCVCIRLFVKCVHFGAGLFTSVLIHFTAGVKIKNYFRKKLSLIDSF